jgi:hypothetical protein
MTANALWSHDAGQNELFPRRDELTVTHNEWARLTNQRVDGAEATQKRKKRR